MTLLIKILLSQLCLAVTIQTSRILAVFPMPSISHQVVFRVLTLELLKRGHEIVVITTDPIYEKDKAPANLTEIDIHELSYNFWVKEFLEKPLTKGNKNDWRKQIETLLEIEVIMFEQQLKSDEIQALIQDKTQKFDLLIFEALVPPSLIFSHMYKIPAIQFSSYGTFPENLKIIGAPSHLFLYPTSLQQRIFNFTFSEYLTEAFTYLEFDWLFSGYDVQANILLKKLFGPDVPKMSELKKHIALMFMNIHPILEFNRPVPQKLVYLGGLHYQQPQELPENLKSYLDSSSNGVIYVSFGTNVDPLLLPQNKIQILMNVFAKLPYNVLFKWSNDDLPGRSNNIKISKWLPQADLLRHPHVKLFITQGGLQSSDEAIAAGVPMICMPMLADQWYNMENFVQLKIGLGVPMDKISEENFMEAIQEVLNNDRYRQNILRLHNLMVDSPHTPLERAVWWTEYVLKHNTTYLNSAAANESWIEYFELELVACLSLIAVFILSVLAYFMYSCLCRKRHIKVKDK